MRLSENQKEFDFIAIGDVTTDAFIRLKEAKVEESIDREKSLLCLSFGDKVPYEFVEEAAAVGNSPNAAVSASRLGLLSALVSDLGDDNNGGECLATLQKNNVATDYVSAHKGKETNYHYVLWFKEERTILVKHHEYDYKLPDIGDPKWVYLSSLGENSMDYHQEIVEYLGKKPDIKLAFQPGTFQMQAGFDKLKNVYKRSEIFFCNVSEAKRILNTKESEIKVLLEEMHKLGPQKVVITDGPRGAYAFDGESKFFLPPYPDPKPPYERTGAGDSFSSTCVVALGLGLPFEKALMWGPINSMSVVQEIGAQKGLLTRDKLEEFLMNAPENYKVERIN